MQRRQALDTSLVALHGPWCSWTYSLQGVNVHTGKSWLLLPEHEGSQLTNVVHSMKHEEAEFGEPMQECTHLYTPQIPTPWKFSTHCGSKRDLAVGQVDLWLQWSITAVIYRPFSLEPDQRGTDTAETYSAVNAEWWTPLNPSLWKAGQTSCWAVLCS